MGIEGGGYGLKMREGKIQCPSQFDEDGLPPNGLAAYVRRLSLTRIASPTFRAGDKRERPCMASGSGPDTVHGRSNRGPWSPATAERYAYSARSITARPR